MFAKDQSFRLGYTFSVRLIWISIETKWHTLFCCSMYLGSFVKHNFYAGSSFYVQGRRKLGLGGINLCPKAPKPLIFASIEKRNKDGQFINDVTVWPLPHFLWPSAFPDVSHGLLINEMPTCFWIKKKWDRLNWLHIDNYLLLPTNIKELFIVQTS